MVITGILFASSFLNSTILIENKHFFRLFHKKYQFYWKHL